MRKPGDSPNFPWVKTGTTGAGSREAAAAELTGEEGDRLEGFSAEAAGPGGNCRVQLRSWGVVRRLSPAVLLN